MHTDSFISGGLRSSSARNLYERASTLLAGTAEAHAPRNFAAFRVVPVGLKGLSEQRGGGGGEDSSKRNCNQKLRACRGWGRGLA